MHIILRSPHFQVKFLSNLTMYLSIFMYLQLLQNVIELGVESLEVGADLLLEGECGLTPTGVFSGNESPGFFKGCTRFLVLVQVVAWEAVTVVGRSPVTHTNVLAAVGAQGTLVTDWTHSDDSQHLQIFVGHYHK